MRSNIAVRNHHAAGNPAQKAAAKINDDWEAIEKFQNNLAAENDEWHGHNQAKDNEQCLMSFMRLLSSTGNGNHIVKRHDKVRHDDCFDSSQQF